MVYETIREWIFSGQYRPGDLLPPEPELIRRFAVSRTTVRKAIEMLAHDSLIVARQGIGTIVLDYHTTQSLNTVTSFTTTLREKGFDVTIKNSYVEIINVDSDLAQILGITVGTQLAMIYRVVCASGVPIAIIRNYVPYFLVSGIEKRSDQIKSLYAFLKSEYDLTVEATHDRISSRPAEIEEALILDIQPKSPLLCVKRVCLRKSIYKMKHLRVDMVLTPYIQLPRPISGYDVSDYVLIYDIERIGDAQHMTDILPDEEALEKIHKATVTINKSCEEEIRQTAHMLFDIVAPKYADVNGGYTAIYKLGPRRGDGAEMALIMLTAPQVQVKAEEPKAAPVAENKAAE